MAAPGSDIREANAGSVVALATAERHHAAEKGNSLTSGIGLLRRDDIASAREYGRTDGVRYLHLLMRAVREAGCTVFGGVLCGA